MWSVWLWTPAPVPLLSGMMGEGEALAAEVGWRLFCLLSLFSAMAAQLTVSNGRKAMGPRARAASSI